MPDVGLFTATEPLSKEMKVVIKYSVEVNGLAVYSESYDVEKLADLAAALRALLLVLEKASV